MTNQLSNEFIFSTNSPIALINDGINLVAQPLPINGQVNNVSAPCVNNGAVAASIWPTVNNNNNNNNNNNPNCEINYNLLQVTEVQQQQQHQPPTQQTVSFSTNNLPQIQAQNMSQIVLLPTQNINLVPNDVGYQLLTNTIPNVGVLVPTNILLTNGYLVLPDSQNACQAIALETSVSTPTNDPSISVPGHLITANVEFDAIAQQQQQQQQQQMLLHQQESAQQQHQQLVQQQEQECEYIALTDSATQTVFSGLAVESSELNNGQPTAHLISSNGQILGIIGSDQLSLLQQQAESLSGGSESQVLLTACIDPNENGLNLNGQIMTDSGTNNYDINTMLAQSISSVVEKSDQDQAKQWLKDSYIVNRALKALKKTSGSSHHHHNRPHPQVIRRRE